MKTFSYDNLKDGETHSLDFQVKEETDNLTKQHLCNSINFGKIHIIDSLMPSELWAAARNLSQDYDKLNEVINCRNDWTILGSANPEDKLRAITTIRKLTKPYIVLETITYLKNKPVLISKDTALLLHDVTHKFQEPKIENAFGEKIGEAEIYFRYCWNIDKWKNNIHTTYAKELGYREEIPEFINYIDLIYAFTKSTKIKITKLLPLYKGDVIDLIRNENEFIFSLNNQVRLKPKIDSNIKYFPDGANIYNKS